MSRLIITTAALSLIVTACASSGRPDRDRDDPDGLRGANVALPVALALTGLGSNPHGPLAIDRLEPLLDAQFDRFDTDGSGALSAIEHARWADAILGDAYGRPTLRMMDRDRDGQASQTEFVTSLLMAARRLDADEDGWVSRAEMLKEVPEFRGNDRSRRPGGSEPENGGRPPR